MSCSRQAKGFSIAAPMCAGISRTAKHKGSLILTAISCAGNGPCEPCRPGRPYSHFTYRDCKYTRQWTLSLRRICSPFLAPSRWGAGVWGCPPISAAGRPRLCRWHASAARPRSFRHGSAGGRVTRAFEQAEPVAASGDLYRWLPGPARGPSSPLTNDAEPPHNHILHNALCDSMPISAAWTSPRDPSERAVSVRQAPCGTLRRYPRQAVRLASRRILGRALMSAALALVPAAASGGTPIESLIAPEHSALDASRDILSAQITRKANRSASRYSRAACCRRPSRVGTTSRSLSGSWTLTKIPRSGNRREASAASSTRMQSSGKTSAARGAESPAGITP